MTVENETDELIELAKSGNQPAREALLGRHRQRLKRMIAIRLDERLARRADPSDVVQETIMVASKRIDQYLQRPAIPFYPWLRQIAWDQIQLHHRRHLDTHARSVKREESQGYELPERSSIQLAQVLSDQQSGPESRLMREESRQRVRASLDQLNPVEREVLVLRFLEQLSIEEAAMVLQISKDAVQMRQLRAIRKLRRIQEEWE